MKRYSIIVDDMQKCLVCNTTQGIHIHEVFYGRGKRSLSIKYGCCVGLCAWHHNGSKDGVHFNKHLDHKLKKFAQKKFMEHYPDLNFVKIFGKNYL